MGRTLRVALALLLSMRVASRGDAQEVFGSLRGTVTDRSGGAVAGVTLRLAGTTLGATSGATGAYRIALVPSGAYALEAQVASGATQRVAVYVGAGGSTTADLVLDSAAVAPIMSVEQAPTSRAVIGGDELRRLAVDDPRQAVPTSPGVVMRGGEIGITENVGLSIRGGASGEAATFVDGAPVRYQTFGGSLLTPGANALSEMSVTTGVSAASVSDARGGVIGYVTRLGGPELRGSVHAEGDGVFGDVLGVGYNRFAADAGGPMPGVTHLSWFASATLQGQSSAYRGVGTEDQPYYTVAGVDTVVQRTVGPATILDTLSAFSQHTGLRRPMDWTTHRLLHGRLLYTFGAGASVSVTGLTSDLESRVFPGASILDPALYMGSRSWSRLLVANWGQPLGRLMGGALALEANVSIASDDEQAGPLTSASDAATRDPAFGIEFGTLAFTGADVFPFPIDDAFIRRMRSYAGPLVPFQGQGSLTPFSAGRRNPYGVSAGWPISGFGTAGIGLVSERRLSTRWLLHWQPGAAHEVTLGVDADRTDIGAYLANMITTLNADAFVGRPRRLGISASDVVRVGNVVFDLGIRYDRFATGGEFPKVPGRIFTSPGWNPDTVATDTAYVNSLARVMDPGRTQGALSPRLRLGWVLSHRTSVRLGYGVQVERPPYGAIYGGTNIDLANTTPSFGFGRDVDLKTSSLLEFGVRHEWTPGTTLDVSVYDKQLVENTVRFVPFFDPVFQTNANLAVLALQSGDAKGADIRVDWHGRGVLGGSVAYSLISASENNGALGPGPVTTHAIYAVLELQAPESSGLHGFDALLAARATSGTPYTREAQQGLGTITPAFGGLPIEPFNASRLPWTKVIDLRITRNVQVGAHNLVAFLDARNLLNFRNVLALFAETGADTNAIFRSNVLAPQFFILYNEAGGNVQPDGTTVSLTNCASWQNPTSCVALRRVEARFGNGDGMFSLAEQTAAFTAAYDAQYGRPLFYGPGRTLRIGIELR